MRTGRGFTLLELLVATTLLSLILVSAMGALRMGSRSWEAGVGRAGKTESLRLAQDTARRLLAQALPLRWPAQEGRGLIFEGTGQNVRFLAPAPRQRRAAGLYQFTLAAERGEEGTQLVLYHVAHEPGGKEFVALRDADKVVLADTLEEVSFEYYGAPRPGLTPQWRNRWPEDAQQLPAGVRIDFGARSDWPELVAAVPAGASR